MFRIGIIGTENSHALAFAKLINLPDEKSGELLYPDAKVVMVYGPDKETAEKVKQEAAVAEIADGVDDFFGKVDAMMVTSRSGSVHFEYSMPFVKAGIPMFIDKPFTSDIKQAVELIETAKENKALLMGGSGCKFAQDTLDLRDYAKKGIAERTLLSGTAKFTIEPESIHDGFFFYASHLVEIALEMFGSDIESVYAEDKNGTIVTLAGYKDFTVALHFTDGNYSCSGTVYLKDGTMSKDIDLSDIYGRETENFINMLRHKKMPQSYEALVLPVHIMESILESAKTGKKISIKHKFL